MKAKNILLLVYILWNPGKQDTAPDNVRSRTERLTNPRTSGRARHGRSIPWRCTLVKNFLKRQRQPVKHKRRSFNTSCQNLNL